MLTLETALRLIVIGQELLIALVFLSRAGSLSIRIGGAFLMLSIVGYLYVSSSVLSSSLPIFHPLATLLGIAVPFALWYFARAVFEAEWPHPVLVGAVVLIGLIVWSLWLARNHVPGAINAKAGIVMRLTSLAIIGHALWLTLRDRPDDLVERRRVFRLLFVGIISLQIAAVLIVELILGGASAPPWLDFTNVTAILVLTLVLSIPLLSLDAEFFEPQPAGDKPATGVKPLGAAEGVYHDKLLELMDTGYYRTTGLTITTLAERLDYPEHRLRQLINGQLGYRNFSEFLNSYRIEAAKQDLSDPEKVRRPVLTIALDLGYASLGPFNRAFRAATGTTPTEFRQQHLAE